MRRVLWIAAGVFAAYWSVSMFAYALRHPELTQTQVLLHTVEAMTWQK